MSEWAKVDGYVALKMMEASTELADLNQRFERLKLDVAMGQASILQVVGVRRHCNKLGHDLGSIIWSFDEAENAVKAAELKIVK